MYSKAGALRRSKRRKNKNTDRSTESPTKFYVSVAVAETRLKTSEVSLIFSTSSTLYESYLSSSHLPRFRKHEFSSAKSVYNVTIDPWCSLRCKCSTALPYGKVRIPALIVLLLQCLPLFIPQFETVVARGWHILLLLF
jgi:hypothetical protein